MGSYYLLGIKHNCNYKKENILRVIFETERGIFFFFFAYSQCLYCLSKFMQHLKQNLTEKDVLGSCFISLSINVLKVSVVGGKSQFDSLLI